MAQDKAIADILPSFVAKKLFSDSIPSIDAFDLDYFEARIKALQAAFPESFITHCLAVKANPIRGVLQFAVKNGLGLEVASVCEALLGLSTGLTSLKVIYGSPCKSKADLEQVIKQGLQINLDNEHEVQIVDQLLKTSCRGTKATFGLRLNPVVGGGALAFTSTATKASKFGLPVMEQTKSKITELYEKYDWLSGVHFHVGSQGIPMELFVKGAKVCFEFVKSLEERGISIKTINIGGGLSSSYSEAEEPEEFSYQAYRSALQSALPDLFSGKYQLITEFGRSLLLKSGTTLSKIEFVKHWIPENNPILMTHVGSNQFLPEIYTPHVRSHRFRVADRSGKVRSGNSETSYDIAGPLCFQGDYVAKNVTLPDSVEPGDILIIHETGAYTMSMYSKFNSLLPSPVYGFSLKSNRTYCFKERETLNECLSFWGSKQPRLA